ncbi:hypothetical protein, partial [Paracoccus sediminilitoris]|uniref:hypothetical protein n=1 Tax=Paracoccus sediminilitoris TaxID=2202419 RepID=UPI001F405B45
MQMFVPFDKNERLWNFSIIGLGMALAPHMAGMRELADRVRVIHAVSRSAARRDVDLPGFCGERLAHFPCLSLEGDG